MEKNYRIYCAMNNIPIEDGVIEAGNDNGDDDGDGMDVDDGIGRAGVGKEDEEWGGIMDVDDGQNDNAADDDDPPEFFKEMSKTNQLTKTPSRRKKTKMGEVVREKIRKVLEDVTELADKRASKCDENDFLKLLFAFNSEGIHFA